MGEVIPTFKDGLWKRENYQDRNHNDVCGINVWRTIVNTAVTEKLLLYIESCSECIYMSPCVYIGRKHAAFNSVKNYFYVLY